MGIKRVLVKNFRSIRSVEFFPTALCSLVGENNAGKSNIVRALNLVFRNRSSRNVRVITGERNTLKRLKIVSRLHVTSTSDAEH